MRNVRPGLRGRSCVVTVVVSICLPLLGACTAEEPDTPQTGASVEASAWEKPVDLSAEDVGLWRELVAPYLEQDLWVEEEAYDAGSTLMLPLEAAFRSGRESWQRSFARQFRRFVDARDGAASDPLTLNRLQYLYLASRFMSLAAASGQGDLVPDGLPDAIRGAVEARWLREPAWQWERDPFPNMKERIAWKLEAPSTSPSYLRAIIDEELFTLAIAAEHRAFETATSTDPSASSEAVAEMVDVALRVVEQEGEWEDSGWLFQVGVWADHPDYAYAGHTEASDDMEPEPRPDTATDSSHSARWPLWLRSFAQAQEEGSKARSTLLRTLGGLSDQFVGQVLVPASEEFPGLRMTNYMDGWNGLYRWNYATAGEGEGYGPYELSGTLLSGYWGLTPDARVGAAYCAAVDEFPLTDEVIGTYVGPNTTRERNPLVQWPDYFHNGFAELQARLACALAPKD